MEENNYIDDDRFFRGRRSIDLKTKIKASAILDQIVPTRSAFILINHDNIACLASSLSCWDGDDGMQGSFCRQVLSLIDIHDVLDNNGQEITKSPLFYKSSELKNIKSMDESDYYKQSVLKQVIPEDECHFVDIDDICNQVLKETNMKHLILILEFCGQHSFLITSNTLEKEDAIVITKSKFKDRHYTRTPSMTKETEELYNKFGNHIFEIPKREYQLPQSTILQYKYNSSAFGLYFTRQQLEEIERKNLEEKTDNVDGVK